MSDQQSAAAAPAAPPAPTPPPEKPAVSKKKEIGKVKWFNSSKGFGFITAGSRDGAGEEVDVFVHQTAIHAQGFRSLQQGEEVEYVAEEGDDGRLRAVEVTGPNGSFVQGATRYGSRGGSRGAKAGPGGSSAPRPSREPQQQQQQQQQTQQTFQFGGVCYNCGIVGHMSRDCQSPGGYYPPPPTIRGRGRGRGGPPPLRQYPDTRTCYSCGAVGHLQRDCPNFVPS